MQIYTRNMTSNRSGIGLEECHHHHRLLKFSSFDFFFYGRNKVRIFVFAPFQACSITPDQAVLMLCSTIGVGTLFGRFSVNDTRYFDAETEAATCLWCLCRHRSTCPLFQCSM
ncbi:unnamed protein product [Ectocarpus sp. 12 AP-2014]